MPHQDPEDDPQYTQPQSFRDTLSTILGQDVHQVESPTLGGLAGAATPLAPNTIATTPEFADHRFTIAHEVGHLVDFANIVPNESEIKAIIGRRDEDEGDRERHVGRQLLRGFQKRLNIIREDPLVSERFADEFEIALRRLEDESPNEIQRRMREFIQDRLQRNIEQQRQLVQNPPAAARSSTAVRR